MSRLVITRRSTTWKRSLRSSEAAVEIPSSTRQAAGSRRTSRKPCFTRFSPSKRLRSRRRFKVPAVAAVREAQARQRAASGTRSASASARSLRNAKRKRVSAQPQEREAQARQRAASGNRPPLQSNPQTTRRYPRAQETTYDRKMARSYRRGGSYGCYFVRFFTC